MIVAFDIEKIGNRLLSRSDRNNTKKVNVSQLGSMFLSFYEMDNVEHKYISAE